MVSGQPNVRVTTPAGRRGLGTVYWRFWTTAGLSNLADGVLKIALPLVAIGFTRSPVLIGGLAFTFTLPWLLFALPSGAIVDRFDRRRLMLGANLVRTAVLAAVVLALLFHRGSIWALYGVAFCAGSAETIYDNAAQSVVPQVVSSDQLVRANGRMFGAQLTANELAGPPLAGVLVAASAAVALGTPVALWVLALAVLVFVRGSFRTERDPATRATLRADIVEGIRFFLHNRLLRVFAILGGAFNIASSATQAILVLYAVGSTSVLALNEQGYSLLVATIAAGSLVGSFLAEQVTRILGRARTLTLSFLAGALLISLPAVTTNPYLIGAAFFVGGIGVVIANVVVLSLRQRITPPQMLSRVNSGTLLITWGTKPLGAAAGAVLAQLFGLRAVFVIMGVVSFAALAGMTRVTDRAMDAAEQAR
ncbi:MAG TPA: MFS transporter [Pseudonocardiaceae bacterium]|nr:MFS transporter [Pseudonocardiaceae bacterium]